MLKKTVEGNNADKATYVPDFREFMQTTEQKYFEDLLSLTDGDIKAVCRISGLSSAQVYRLLRKYNFRNRF